MEHPKLLDWRHVLRDLVSGFTVMSLGALFVGERPGACYEHGRMQRSYDAATRALPEQFQPLLASKKKWQK